MNRVYKFNTVGECVASYDSQSEAAYKNNVTRSAMSLACKARLKIHGFIFTIEPEFERNNVEFIHIDKVEGLGDFIKESINEIGCEFSADELSRLGKIKAARLEDKTA